MAASLPQLDRIPRDSLVNGAGRSLKEVRRSLVLRVGRVWLDIAGGYVGLVASALGTVWLGRAYPSVWPVSVVLGALGIGYSMAFIQLFFHEAVHYNVASTRRTNDLLANAFVGIWIGSSVKAYRVVHFDHHRHLGTTLDTERSYFEALNVRFVLEALTGLKMVRVLTARGKHVAKSVQAASNQERPAKLAMLLLGLAVNLAVMVAAAFFHDWALLLAWPFGVLVVHPAINAIRQNLEHRSFDADADVDYSRVDHGVMTRSFGAGPFASTFGGAGFNRHILHHWDPQLSYTRFAEMEAFLLETEAAEVLQSVTTTYARTFFKLLRNR
jgi:fatty acid desaturase